MQKEKEIALSPSVLEFVTVAAEYCATLEQHANYSKAELIQKLHKLLPLLYLKALLLPAVELEDEEHLAAYVQESDWNHFFFNLKEKLGEDTEYLEVFDERMTDSDAPVVASLAENFADIYQDLKNFLTNYHLGTEEVMNESLWKLNFDFTRYWGQYLVNALRALHNLKKIEEERF